MGFSIKLEKTDKYVFSKQQILQLALFPTNVIEPDSGINICGDLRNDIEYKFTIFSDKPVEPIKVELYFNDEDYKIAYGEFNDQSMSAVLTPCFDYAPFYECYGIMQLSVNLIFPDGKEQIIKTGYISVLVHDKDISLQVENMVKYITDNCEPLIYQKHQFSKVAISGKKSKQKSIEGTTQILKRILKCYKSKYAFFKSNAKSKIVSKEVIGSFQKLGALSYNTLRYISIHPEQLEKTTNISSIKYEDNNYLPKQTLISDKYLSKEVYENIVIISFLKMIVSIISSKIIPTINHLINSVPEATVTNDSEYINSAFCIFNTSKRMLKEQLNTFLILKREYKSIYSAYKELWKIKADSSYVLTIPKYTMTFRQNPTYHEMYINIKQWYDNGRYEFEKEKFIVLSFLKSSKIYEYFILLKLIEAIKNQPNVNPEFIPDKSVLCMSFDYNNVFRFSSNSITYELFFQPIINQPHSNTSIGLYRNNKYTVKGKNTEKAYTPDYLLRIESQGRNKFIVFDAKFRDEAEVKKSNFYELSFKYIFSFTPTRKEDQLLGMCILCGKDKKNRDNAITNAYNSNNEHMFFADFPIITGKDVYESNTLSKLLNKYSDGS